MYDRLKGGFGKTVFLIWRVNFIVELDAGIVKLVEIDMNTDE